MTEKLFFPEVKKGYDKRLVDNYIAKLSDAYQTAYNEYHLILNKYSDLLEERIRFDLQGQPDYSSEGIDKTLLYMERLTKSIIADAVDEATEAKAEATRIIAKAYAEAAKVKEMAQRILDESCGEAAAIIDWAGARLKQTYIAMREMAEDAQKHSTSDDWEDENGADIQTIQSPATISGGFHS